MPKRKKNKKGKKKEAKIYPTHDVWNDNRDVYVCILKMAYTVENKHINDIITEYNNPVIKYNYYDPIKHKNKGSNKAKIKKFWKQYNSKDDCYNFNYKATKFHQYYQESMNNDSKSSTDNVYIGNNEIIKDFPTVIAMQKKEIKYKINNCDFNIIFKEYMDNYYQKYNNEMEFDTLDNTHIKGGKINYLLSPNKNLGIYLYNDLCGAVYQKLNFNIFCNFHCWIPSIFSIDYGYNVTIKNEIHNLNRHKYSKLYNIYIPIIFKKMVPMFEAAMNTVLKNSQLKVIVQIKDYEINDKDLFIGGIHKDGLFEKIEGIGIYYYHIDSNIIGGDLELHACITTNDGHENHGYKMRKRIIPIKERNVVVFNNAKTYHKVTETKLKDGQIGHRKAILFFVIKDKEFENILDTSVFGVNLQYSMIIIVNHWFNISSYNRYIFGNNMELYNYNIGYKWMYDIIQMYLIGNNEYRLKTTQNFRKSRKIYRYESFKKKLVNLTANGYTRQRFNWRRQDW